MKKVRRVGESGVPPTNKVIKIDFSTKGGGSDKRMKRLLEESAREIVYLRRSVRKDLQDRQNLMKTGRMWSMTEALKATEKILGKQRLSEVPTIRLYKLRLRYLELLGRKGEVASL
jgi:3-phenylpropionate/cinnamic acid dioxygenase small subunit